MGYLEAQNRYKEKRGLAKQSVEDLVARRVLRGLGVVQKDVPRLDKDLFGDHDYDEALWPCVLRMWKYIMERTHNAAFFKAHQILVLEVGEKHKEVLDRLDTIQYEDIVTPVILTRIRGSKISMAYLCRRPEDVGMLTPPYKVIKEVNGFHLTMVETEAYIKSLGPFDLGAIK